MITLHGIDFNHGSNKRRFIFLTLDTKIHAIRAHLFSLSIHLDFVI